VNIVFRVDASNKVGSGHFFRCFEIASKFNNKNKIFFISEKINQNLVSMLKKKKIKLLNIPSKKNNNYEERDLKDTIDVIKKKIKKKVDLLILDSYLLGKKWEKKITFYTKKILVIDDLDRSHDCDYYLNQNLYINKKIDKKLNKYTKKFKGLKYCLVRYKNHEKKLIVKKPRKIKNILVFFGGADRQNLTIKLIKILSNKHFNKLNLKVVVGLNNKNYSKIIKYASKRSKTRVFYNLKSLKKHIMQSDIAISSGGSFIWECIFFGLPALVLNQSKNQINNSKILNKINAIKLYKNKLNNFIELKKFLKLNLMYQNFVIPRKIYNMIDGNGSQRLIKSLM